METRADKNVLADIIKAHDWAVMRVDGEAQEPNYAYSVGLFGSFGHPEVIMFGLPPDTLQELINVIGDEVRQGKRFEPFAVAEDLLEGYPCTLRPVASDAVRAYMGRALEYYEKIVPAIHCIWPDREGRFPWDRGVSPEFRRLQPMLSEGPERSTTSRP